MVTRIARFQFEYHLSNGSLWVSLRFKKIFLDHAATKFSFYD